MNKKGLNDYLESYKFIEDLSGKSIINLLKTVEIIRFVYDSLFASYNISAPKFSAMLLLYESLDDGMLLSEIGDKLFVSRANITGLIDRMEREGLVIKKPNEKDKRSTIAYLTKKGRDLFESVKQEHINFSENMTKTLSVKEKEDLNFYLQTLQRDIVNHFGEDDEI